MMKSLLAATMGLALMTGGAFAQSAASGTFQQTSPYAPPNAIVPMADTVDSTTHKSTSDGVVTDKSKSVSHDGDTTTTRKSSDTTVR